MVNCQNCNATGHASDEAEQRTVLWVCEQCDVRYLVSKSGMHRAPAPPKRRATGGEAMPLPLSIEVDTSHLQSSTPSIAGKASKSEARASAAATAADDWTIDLSSTKATSESPLGSPLLGGRAPIYPLIDLPVRDPLWRRPALLASALAGLLVGLAAYGMKWTREYVAPDAQPVEIAATLPAADVDSSMARETESVPDRLEVVSEAAQPGILVERTVPPLAAATGSESKASSAKARRAAKLERKRRARSLPEVAAAAPTEPLPTAVEPPRPSEPPTLAEAMAVAAGSDQREPRALAEPKAKTSPAAAESGFEAGSTTFSRDAAISALSVASVAAARCRATEGPFGSARVAVTFAPSGQATIAVIEGPPFAGTQVGSCVARAFREARVRPFSGGPVTVRKSVRIF